MAKLVKQYRYYNDSDGLNYPTTMTSMRLRSGSIFFTDDQLEAIVELKIQALPGTKFYLNYKANPIIIDSTGIYELNVDTITEITGLFFENESIQKIRDTEGAYLIVNALYTVKE